jgi:DNA (cytosine-5)-methyltransferase 1
MKNIRAIDLFSGIGGVKLGLKKAGFNVIYSNDNDKYCQQTFEANFPEKLDTRDIALIPSKDIPDHDLLAAGFPCQPFSMAGHRKGFADPRGSLFLEVVRILRDKNPKAFLLENVKNLKSHNKGETLKTILFFLEEELGYSVFYKVLNSKDFGLPQNRERIYIVGFRDKVDFEFPKPKKLTSKIADLLETDVDDSYFLSQKYYEGLVSHKARHQAKGSGFGFEILDHNGISHSLVVGNMGRERNLIKDSPRKHFYSQGMDKATTKNSLGVRKLTVRECSRLQGFPKKFVIPVSRTQAYKQFGNTISVPVIKVVAKEIMKTLNKEVVLKDSYKSDYVVASV